MTTPLDKLHDNAGALSKRFNSFLAEIAYDHFKKTALLKNESNFHVAMYLSLLTRFNIINAEEATNQGKMDVNIRTPSRVFIFEFKYNRTSEATLAKIDNKGYTEQFQKYHVPIVCICVNFRSNSKENAQHPETKYKCITSISIKVEYPDNTK